MPIPSVVIVLARAFLAGPPDVEQVIARAGHALGKPWRWLTPLAARYADAFAGRTRPRQRDVVAFLRNDPGFQRAWARSAGLLKVAHWLTPPQKMQPVAAAAVWEVPAIESAGDLAAWLGLEDTELAWFADLKRLGYKTGRQRLRHYHYRVLAKQFGAIRLIEAPKPNLKQLQRRILARILYAIPPHPSAHGFVRGRSIRTFVATHVGQRVVLRMDLRDFFPSIGAARIQAFFRTAGYPEPVADLLTGICTNVAPRDLWRELGDSRALYARPHLPQGAPTSPALANVCAYQMDCRLTGLARSAGAAYTRYADDLAFSGGAEFERSVERFAVHVAAIAGEEGFRVNHRKTRVMRAGVRQHLAGLVTNRRINIRRDDYDRLKATLINCVRRGPEGQNRDGHRLFRAHLEGRVAFVESVHPARGARLRRTFDLIQWPPQRD